MKEYYNCFIGVPLDSEFKYELEEIQKKMQLFMPNASISEPSLAHLTLYYLGKQTSKSLEEISNIIFEEKDIIEGEKLTIGEKGIFNRVNSLENIPYVIYLKVSHSNKLLELKEHLASHLDSYNKDDERSFIPHVTLCRLKTTESLEQYNERKTDIENLLNKIKWEFKLKEIYIYGKTNMDSSKFQDVLFKISLI